MTSSLYFPADELVGADINADLAADFIELSAFFAPSGKALFTDLVAAAEIGGDGAYADVDEEIRTREEIVGLATATVERRRGLLGSAYPFELVDGGYALAVSGTPTLGGGCYWLCLILSHLRAVSPVLENSNLHPSEEEVIQLRRHFQAYATAAMAAEVNGHAWSFGFPRPDGSGFFQKLHGIWAVLKDGEPNDEGEAGAPAKPKDDQLDVIAARMHRDGGPGFLCAFAQVASGDGWKAKPIRDHVQKVFFKRWFGRQPVTDALVYQVIPFSRSADEFRDDCLVLGNVLHRDRMPLRVDEAQALVPLGVQIEAFSELPAMLEWMVGYRGRGST
jgi:hypothetical protein